MKNGILRVTLFLFAMAAPVATIYAQPATGTPFNIVNENSGKCIGASYQATTNGTVLEMYSCADGTYSSQLAQQWIFTAGSGGYYEVADAGATAEAWNVVNNGTSNGSPMQIWSYTGNPNEEFKPVSLGGGYYKFVGQGSGLCLDVPGNSTANSVQLDIYTCNGTTAQAFKLVSASGGGEGPYGGTPAAIPGTVMAENYDTGGQGAGYNVTAVNGTDNGYRADGADLEIASPPATGNDIGWTASGQWFRYTVNVSSAGTYTVSFLVAAENAISDAFHLSNASGANLSGAVAVPNTGNWQAWTTVKATVTLPAGLQTLTLSQDNAGWNIDSMTFASGSGNTPQKIFAPFEYLGDLSDANQLPGIISASGVNAVVLAFLVPMNNGCNLAWGGVNGALPYDTLGSTSIANEVAALQNEGVTVVISQGGAGGQDGSAYCGTVAQTQAVYQSVINKYHVTWLDFDLENPQTSGQPTRRAQALAALQKANPGLKISYTLPLGPGGLDPGDNGTGDLSAAAAAGLNLYVVNGMAMDFGANGANQATETEEGAAALEAQIKSSGLSATVGLTVLPGTSDDTPPQYFTLANATTVLNFANANSYVTMLSFWELNRDNGNCPGSTVDEDTCSGISQYDYEFSSIFNAF